MTERSLAAKNCFITCSELCELSKVSRDGSGEIDFEEFAVMMQGVKKGSASLGWGRIKRCANISTIEGIAQSSA